MNDVDYLSHVVVKHIEHTYHACCLRCGYKSFNSDREMLKRTLQGHACEKEKIVEEVIRRRTEPSPISTSAKSNVG